MTGRQHRPLLLALLLFASLCLLGPGGAARAEDEAKQPYELQVVLYVARHPLLTPVFKEQVQRELGDGLQAALGDLARVTVTDQHPRLRDVLARGLERELDGWRERSDVKTHFVLIDFSGVNYEIRARQYDGLTGHPSPVVRFDRVRDRAFVAKAAALLVEQDFGLEGTITGGPDVRDEVQVTLRGGGLGVPLERWIKPGEVFSLYEPSGGSGPDPLVPWTLLQVKESPQGGVCTCQLFSRYKNLQVSGNRCVMLGTIRAPLHLRFMEEQPNGQPTPLETQLPIEIRRHGFKGEESEVLRDRTNQAGEIDTSGRGPAGVFDRAAFVTVFNTASQVIAIVPVPVLSEQFMVVPISTSKVPFQMSRLRLVAWRRNVSDALRVQNTVFAEIKQMQSREGQEEAVLKKAQAGLRRSQEDYSNLSAERARLVKETTGSPPNLTAEDQQLSQLQDGSAELRRFVEDQEKVVKEATDPKRKQWLAQINKAKLLENDGEVGKAIDIYQQVLSAGLKSDEVAKHLEELRKEWANVAGGNADTRSFIYDIWPELDTPGVKDNIDKAQKAFEVCRAANDRVGAVRLFKGTMAHALRMQKEASELHPNINIDDEKPAKLIQELAPKLGKLARDIKTWLDSKR